MDIKGKVHCFFEQSGTFKNEFIKLGVPAEDYDIQNNFGQTDHVVDLFKEIVTAYEGGASVFDSISYDDLVVAFFPCIMFSQQNSTFFDGTNTNYQYGGYSERQIADLILERSRKRQMFYEVALQMFNICSTRGIRLIVENPYSEIHYLKNNFMYKPRLIDRNRQKRGDYFKKPTQYWFINCEPTEGFTEQLPKQRLSVNQLTGHKGSLCDEDRSMISPDYARNFICDSILGRRQPNIDPTLFDAV